jgi:hypothetical protein
MRQRVRYELMTIASAATCLAMLGGVATASTTAGPAGASGAWKIQSTYAPPQREVVLLNQVSCPAANACLALGVAGKRFLSETWNGTTWTPLLNTFALQSATLSGLSCSGKDACTAVGFGSNGTAGVNMAERWNGSGWQEQTVPAPAGVQTFGLSSVSCPGEASCVAVGNDEPAAQPDTTDTTSDVWNGTSWAVQTMPSTGQQKSELSGVSCPTATDCVAVGHQGNNTGTQSYALIEGWNGTSWTTESPPALPASDQAGLYSVSCAAADSCTALGEYLKNGQGDLVDLVEHWNGTSWAIVHGLSAYIMLDGLSCPSTTSCTAVGAGGEGPEAAQWNGKSWTYQLLPVPADAIGHSINLNVVSCPTTSRCEAVGYFLIKPKTAAHRYKTIIEGN